MKRLFDDNDIFSEEGRLIHHKATKLLEPLFKEYADQGYSIRDLIHVIAEAATESGLELIIHRRLDYLKSKN